MMTKSAWTSLSLFKNLSNYGILSIGIAGADDSNSATVYTMLPYYRFKNSTTAMPAYAYWDPNDVSDSNKIMACYISDTSINYYCGANFGTHIRLVILGWKK